MHFSKYLNTGFSIAGAPQLRVGLDEELSVPDDSYLIKYFDYMERYLSVGPPFYVVLNNTGKDGFDLSVPDLRHRICGSANCNDDSLQAQIMLWSFQSNISAVSTMAQVKMELMKDFLAGKVVRTLFLKLRHFPGPMDSKSEIYL